MLDHRLYYALKPFMPWRVRMALRRIYARRQRLNSQAVWPINNAAGKMPAGWPGWPDGKKFALVLTHDIEGPKGLARCRQLAELEMELGFRSSFNFIPEGPYKVDPELRAWLTENGFEVGVHDLEHDGRLYQSRASFKRKAVRINHYLREWGADGFRSGFMLRNLDWLHKLNIHYDTSTFDTDPFEFQSNGADTIFPFWIQTPPAADSQVPFTLPADVVTASSRGGYLELPYTLPQDSTLFLVLRETSPEIWVQKLDWIAGRGGMALVNVHPDYMNLAGSASRQQEYPAAWYFDFLRHASQKFGGTFWNPLPMGLARWYRDACQKTRGATPAPVPQPVDGKTDSGRFPGLRGQRVAVLLYSSYPSDPRPRRAAEALAQLGMEVEVICLKQNKDELVEEVINGVAVRRVPLKHRRGGKLAYAWQYASFLTMSFLILGRRALGRHYQLVHVHNMPDILVFSALIPKLRGARLILDLHDPMPELMTTIFGINQNSTGVAVLKRLEKWSIGVADVVLTVNEACKKIFSARSCAAAKIRVVMNSPDEGIFRYRDAAPAVPRVAGAPFVIMYHGSLVERHGLDLAVSALGLVRPSIPGAELRIYGQRTPFLDQVMNSVQGSDLREAVHYFGPKNLEQIVEAIGACDVGVIPNRRSIFTEINTPTRIFEYLSQAKPVIAPRAPGILDYFGPDELVFFELGDARDLAAKIAQVFEQPEQATEIVRRGQKIYRDHRWSNERGRFVSKVAELLGVPEQAETAAGAPAAATSGGHP